MKNLLLKLFASESLKKGIAFALQVSEMVIDAIRGILAGDNLPDDKRGKLAVILTAITSVYNFLQRFAELLGVTPQAGVQSLNDLADKVNELDKITDGL